MMWCRGAKRCKQISESRAAPWCCLNIKKDILFGVHFFILKGTSTLSPQVDRGLDFNAASIALRDQRKKIVELLREKMNDC